MTALFARARSDVRRCSSAVLVAAALVTSLPATTGHGRPGPDHARRPDRRRRRRRRTARAPRSSPTTAPRSCSASFGADIDDGAPARARAVRARPGGLHDRGGRPAAGRRHLPRRTRIRARTTTSVRTAATSSSTCMTPTTARTRRPRVLRRLPPGPADRHHRAGQRVDGRDTRGNRDSFDPSISADGQRVVFTVAGRPTSSARSRGASENVYVRDYDDGHDRARQPELGGRPRPQRSPTEAAISADGETVVFTSGASNLDTGALRQRPLLAPPRHRHHRGGAARGADLPVHPGRPRPRARTGPSSRSSPACRPARDREPITREPRSTRSTSTDDTIRDSAGP